MMNTELDYETWYTEAGNLVMLAHELYRWAPFPIPDELGKLEELIATVEPPPEPEPDYDDWHSGSGEAYWTIERMFEDL
jgi:hypothetical protein